MRSLTKVLRSPEKLCDRSQNFEFTNYCIALSNIAFSCKTFTFFCKTLVFSLKNVVPLKNFAFFCKKIAFFRKTIAFPWETLRSFAKHLQSFAKLLRCPEEPCSCLQNQWGTVFFTPAYTRKCTQNVCEKMQKHLNIIFSPIFFSVHFLSFFEHGVFLFCLVFCYFFW